LRKAAGLIMSCSAVLQVKKVLFFFRMEAESY